jgi:hypothetical protein
MDRQRSLGLDSIRALSSRVLRDDELRARCMETRSSLWLAPGCSDLADGLSLADK